jgi:hypothetical protein
MRTYQLNDASAETGAATILGRFGHGGPIIGKRCGWTQNSGRHRNVCLGRERIATGLS